MTDDDRSAFINELLARYAPPQSDATLSSILRERSTADILNKMPYGSMPITNILAKYGVPLQSPRDTRPFPGLSDALNVPLNRLSEFSPEAAGLLSFLSRRPSARLPWSSPTVGSQALEWPTQAAIRVGDRIFSGPHHLGASENAQAALGEKAWRDALERLSDADVNGFVTNHGRYVSRQEAGDMLDVINGTNHYQPSRLPGKSPLRMYSEALDLYDAKGRENPNWKAGDAEARYYQDLPKSESQ